MGKGLIRHIHICKSRNAHGVHLGGVLRRILRCHTVKPVTIGIVIALTVAFLPLCNASLQSISAWTKFKLFFCRGMVQLCDCLLRLHLTSYPIACLSQPFDIWPCTSSPSQYKLGEESIVHVQSPSLFACVHSSGSLTLWSASAKKQVCGNSSVVGEFRLKQHSPFSMANRTSSSCNARWRHSCICSLVNSKFEERMFGELLRGSFKMFILRHICHSHEVMSFQNHAKKSHRKRDDPYRYLKEVEPHVRRRRRWAL